MHTLLALIVPLLLLLSAAHAQEHGPVGAYRDQFDWQWREVS